MYVNILQTQFRSISVQGLQNTRFTFAISVERGAESPMVVDGTAVVFGVEVERWVMMARRSVEKRPPKAETERMNMSVMR